jgi:uncharacterized protein YbaR (Trm112 family)
MLRTSLQNLVSPITGQPLQLDVHSTDGDDVREGALRAGADSFPIVEGIPRFVPEDVAADQTVRSFAQKWAKHRYYREHTVDFYTRWYVERYQLGEGGLRDLLRGARFALDAGTGSGRDATNFAKNGDALVYGVDTAWEALRVTSAEVKLPNIAFVHADVNRPAVRSAATSTGRRRSSASSSTITCASASKTCPSTRRSRSARASPAWARRSPTCTRRSTSRTTSPSSASRRAATTSSASSIGT